MMLTVMLFLPLKGFLWGLQRAKLCRNGKEIALGKAA